MRKACIALFCLVIAPSIAFAQASAQASITGTVRDASGGLLPGVTVEVASPALIEKVRVATSDRSGQYRIVDLPPGIYSVTFVLDGFGPVRREGIQLSGAFTATVSVQLQVGGLEETITVSGESPMVDVQSSRRQQVMDRELVNAIPSARAYHSLVALVPGITASTNDVGGLTGPATVVFSIHGGRGNEGRLQVDGMGVGSTLNGGGVSYYAADVGNAEEIVITTSGGLGEAEVGGPVMSIVPRTGGNRPTGSFYFNTARGSMQSDNFTQELRDAGLRLPNSMTKMWDVNGSFGGPILRDRLWFYQAVRNHGNRKYVTNMFFNRNAGDPDSWTYEPDTRRAFNDGTFTNASLRLTFQPSRRHNLNIFWDEQYLRQNHLGGGTPTTSPEAAGTTDSGPPYRARQVTWRAPVTNRLLLEAGFGNNGGRWGGRERSGNPTADLIRVQEQGGPIPNMTYRSMNWNDHFSSSNRWRASATYVTGSHNLKAGYEGQWLIDNQLPLTNNHRLTYRFNSPCVLNPGVPAGTPCDWETGSLNPTPNRLTMSAQTFQRRNRQASNSFYVQNQSTFQRMTLQAALRYDYAYSRFLEQQIGPDRFIPNPIVLPAQRGVEGFHDISPRVGVTYDLFGDGMTSVKVNWGRYLEPSSNASRYTATNPATRIVTSTNRNWTDANGNFIPDCDLLNPAVQDLRASGGDLCGPWSNQNFGSSVPGTDWDPALLRGWGVRPNDGQLGISLQRELIRRTSVEIGYNRRWFGNFTVTDNLLVGPDNYDPYSITVPVDPRLPGGGGYTITDLWNVKPEFFGQSQNRIVAASDYGKRIQYWHGLDINLVMRSRNGLSLQGGTSTGRQVDDDCDVIVNSPSRRNCRVTQPFRTQVKGLGSYVIPRVDVQVSGTFQSRPGGSLNANWVVPNAVVQQTLGRPLSGNASSVTINVLDPWQATHDRVNQVDLRFQKIFRRGGTRTNIGVDVYNAFNTAAVLSRQQAFNPNTAAWRTPTGVLDARFAKISAQIDF